MSKEEIEQNTLDIKNMDESFSNFIEQMDNRHNRVTERLDRLEKKLSAIELTVNEHAPIMTTIREKYLKKEGGG